MSDHAQPTTRHAELQGNLEDLPVTNQAAGSPESLKNKVLETGASLLQSFEPPKRLCAHLNAFHISTTDPTRISEANHYCAHVNDEVRQCILYDSPAADARLIGIEYMISARLYASLPPAERALWHSHVYEVKSGMLIMPTPAGVPEAAWRAAENAEMEQVVHLYGKVYELWRPERGEVVPMGPPELMTSFTAEGQFADFERRVGERDERFGRAAGGGWREKGAAREYIRVPEVHPDADAFWKEKGQR